MATLDHAITDRHVRGAFREDPQLRLDLARWLRSLRDAGVTLRRTDGGRCSADDERRALVATLGVLDPEDR